MSSLDDSRLYRDALGADASQPSPEIVLRLRQALDTARKNVAALAQGVAHDMPGYTDHGVEHLDAVWATADVVAGETWSMNAAEAFVFGCAVLVHDLAMTTAAFPGGRAAVEATPEYADALAAARSAADDGDDDEGARALALATALRVYHARVAAELPNHQFEGPDGPRFLIEDSDLRDQLGWIVGQIAAGHGEDLAVVDHQLATSRVTPADVGGLSVDALTLAALLRCADACQLDVRRARPFARIRQAPGGIAADHWRFQGLMHPVRLQDDRLVFESARPFRRDDASAWWVGHELLGTADREIRDVDALLTDCRPDRRFAARRVAGIESPRRLAEHVHTDGWVPVDARLRASNAIALARSLGGRQLYGRTPMVPLREMIQNAADAVRARRMLEGDDYRGVVEVATTRDDEGRLVLHVSDNGIGMPESVITGALLDFGTSYWKSSAAMEALPGLIGAGFEPVGQFGIGFFSAFMWSDDVRVISRSFNGGPDATLVLEFAGLDRQPILRVADRDERRREPGTTVSIATGVWELSDLEGVYGGAPSGLPDLVGWLAPALDVDLRVRESGVVTDVAEADDWMSIDPVLLAERAAGERVEVHERERISRAMGRFLDDERTVGRAVLWEEGVEALRGVLTVGGLRSEPLRGVVGVVQGEQPTAARTEAVPMIGKHGLRAWIAEQLDELERLELFTERFDLASLAIRCGLPTRGLPLCVGHEGTMNEAALRAWARAQEGWIIIVGDELSVEDVPRTVWSGLTPAENALTVREPFRHEWINEIAYGSSLTPAVLADHCREILREEWGSLRGMWDHIDDADHGAVAQSLEIGTDDGSPVFSSQYDAYCRAESDVDPLVQPGPDFAPTDGAAT